MYKACFVADNTYDPGVSPGFANQCILGGMCLRSNLSKEANLVVDIVSMVLGSRRWDLRLDCTGCRKLKSLQSNEQGCIPAGIGESGLFTLTLYTDSPAACKILALGSLV